MKKLYKLCFMMWTPADWSKDGRDIMNEEALYYGELPQQKGDRLKEQYEEMGYEVFGFHYYEAVIFTD